jgi:hypothetical protein
VESRPLSKLKRWQLSEVLRRAVQVAVEPSALDIVGVGPLATGPGKRKKS